MPVGKVRPAPGTPERPLTSVTGESQLVVQDRDLETACPALAVEGLSGLARVGKEADPLLSKCRSHGLCLACWGVRAGSGLCSNPSSRTDGLCGLWRVAPPVVPGSLSVRWR